MGFSIIFHVILFLLSSIIPTNHFRKTKITFPLIFNRKYIRVKKHTILSKILCEYTHIARILHEQCTQCLSVPLLLLSSFSLYPNRVYIAFFIYKHICCSFTIVIIVSLLNLCLMLLLLFTNAYILPELFILHRVEIQADSSEYHFRRC